MRWWKAIALLGVLGISGCGGGGGGGGGVVTDTTPPAISGLQTRYEGDQLVVLAQVVDVGSGVQRVWVERRGLDTVPREVEMLQLQGTNTYRAVITAPTARIIVRARDGAGNVSQTEETRVPPPSPPF